MSSGAAEDADDTGPRACLACGARASTVWATARDEEYHTGPESYTFRRCDACDVLFIDPVPRDELTRIYPPTYYSVSDGSSSAVYRLKAWLDRRLFRSLVRRLGGPELRVLDVGGGAGWELSLIKSIEPRVKLTMVVDIAAGAADAARAAGHEYFCGRVEDFVSEERFDLVLMLNVIEHVDDPHAVLGKIRGLLSLQGVVLVKTPNYESLDARLFRHANWGGYHCPRHWVLFNRESFVALADRAGLSVQRFQYTQGAPFWATSLLIGLARHKLIAITTDRPLHTHSLYSLLVPLFAAFDFARRPFAKLSQMFVVLERRPT